MGEEDEFGWFDVLVVLGEIIVCVGLVGGVEGLRNDLVVLVGGNVGVWGDGGVFCDVGGKVYGVGKSDGCGCWIRV